MTQTDAPERINLTKPRLEAIRTALHVALAGGGFDGGDFEGQEIEHFERALDWVVQESIRRYGFDG